MKLPSSFGNARTGALASAVFNLPQLVDKVLIGESIQRGCNLRESLDGFPIITAENDKTSPSLNFLGTTSFLWPLPCVDLSGYYDDWQHTREIQPISEENGI